MPGFSFRKGQGALQVRLSDSDVMHIEEAIPASAIAGTRYDKHSMQSLDSEQ
jgi:hypothetical protein